MSPPSSQRHPLDVSAPPPQKERQQLDMLHVRGAAVRFVHVPGRLDPNAAILQHRKRVAEAAKAARRQHEAAMAAAAAATAAEASALAPAAGMAETVMSEGELEA